MKLPLDILYVPLRLEEIVSLVNNTDGIHVKHRVNVVELELFNVLIRGQHHVQKGIDHLYPGVAVFIGMLFFRPPLEWMEYISNYNGGLLILMTPDNMENLRSSNIPGGSTKQENTTHIFKKFRLLYYFQMIRGSNE
eukprot:6209339-Prymnesium_polylepis.1